MPVFVFAYHGGSMPENEADSRAEMARWRVWFEHLGAAIVDGGKPVGLSKTVTAGGVENNGGANPLSGYSLVSAQDIDAACVLAGGCPILAHGGSVEVAEAIDLDV